LLKAAVAVGPSLLEHTPAINQFQAVNDPREPLAALSRHDQEVVLQKVALALM
jgi:hypothetical protein